MAERRRRRRLPGATINRVLAVAAFLPTASRSPIYARLVWSLISDDRVPAARKALLAGALATSRCRSTSSRTTSRSSAVSTTSSSSCSAVDLFLDGVPAAILDEKLAELGIERAAFDRDIAQIRRLTPLPVRRARPAPPAGRRRGRRAGARHPASDRGSGPGINKEGSLA